MNDEEQQTTQSVAIALALVAAAVFALNALAIGMDEGYVETAAGEEAASVNGPPN